MCLFVRSNCVKRGEIDICKQFGIVLKLTQNRNIFPIFIVINKRFFVYSVHKECQTFLNIQINRHKI